MRNLAGNPDCDRFIRDELTRCGITVVEASEAAKDEVPAKLSGKIGNFTLRRAWYYWIAEGFMPMEQAEILYADPVGRTDIRVTGHCGCPSPAECAVYYDNEGKKLVSDPNGLERASWIEMINRHPDIEVFRKDFDGLRFVPDAKADAYRAGIESYHIDSELGLYLFAIQARKT